MEGHGTGVRGKNGPPLAGHGAEAVRNAIAAKIVLLPEVETITHMELKRIDGPVCAASNRYGSGIYFCDPQSAWQRGTNENTNGLLRQNFPKGTDISRYTERELDAVADALNCRPRKSLGWSTGRST
jgi:IS30 family transposase